MTTITVLTNQTIYDLSQKYYGGQEGVFDIAKLNGISFSTVLVPGQKLLVDDTKRAAVERMNRPTIAKAIQTAYEATVTDGQSVYDLSVQHYGSIDGLFSLLKGSEIQFKTPLKGGTKLKMDKKYIVNQEFAKYFEGSSRRISTYRNVQAGEGIGAMGIEFDFIVR